jgi:hypothetical protein
VRIDESIDGLAEALTAEGMEPPPPPSEPFDLDAIDAEIAPMSLPAEVRRFWERVDPWSLRVWAYPHPSAPHFGLDTWKQHRDEFPGMAPRALFLVGYESWACMSVELDSPFARGGALFEWRLEDGGFHLRYHELSGWLDRITELLVAGAFERREGPEGPVLWLRDPDAMLSMSELPAPKTPNPVHGDVTYIGRPPLEWPLHWQRLSGIEPEDVKPRGATHTIAELLASDPSQPLVATIAALVVDLGSFGSGTFVRVSDGTGVMTIGCPLAITTLGPGMRQEYEFDVIVSAGERRTPPDPGALEPLADPVKDISQRLMARYGGPPTAVATAVRPLGAP